MWILSKTENVQAVLCARLSARIAVLKCGSNPTLPCLPAGRRVGN